ncbi:hypothetical protein EMIT0P265_10736 [Pseudomonas zeae]
MKGLCVRVSAQSNQAACTLQCPALANRCQHREIFSPIVPSTSWRSQISVAQSSRETESPYAHRPPMRAFAGIMAPLNQRTRQIDGCGKNRQRVCDRQERRQVDADHDQWRTHRRAFRQRTNGDRCSGSVHRHSGIGQAPRQRSGLIDCDAPSPALEQGFFVPTYKQVAKRYNLFTPALSERLVPLAEDHKHESEKMAAPDRGIGTGRLRHLPTHIPEQW